jgi:hypothetical protein
VSVGSMVQSTVRKRISQRRRSAVDGIVREAVVGAMGRLWCVGGDREHVALAGLGMWGRP